MNEIKVGNIVKIIDGSYAVRMDIYEEYTSIGGYKNDFEVLHVNYDDHITTSDGNVSLHNIHIQNCRTNAIYLHSKAFVSIVPQCPTCGQRLPNKD